MSRQIQIRRGTAAENDAFTGAIGEITMDTTNKTLRVHDGETPGGTTLAKQSEIPDLTNIDYVVESQLPTAENNYTWYRKYKSGWVEQGGTWTGNLVCADGQEVTPTISLPIIMSDKKYYAIASVVNTYLFHMGSIRNKSTLQLRFGAYTVSRTLSEFTWYVCGKAA